MNPKLKLFLFFVIILATTVSVQAGKPGAERSLFPSDLHADTLPSFQLDVTSIDFGAVFITAVHVETVTVSNSSLKDLFITSVTVDSGEFSVTPNSGTVPASGSMQFYVSFAPTTENLQSGNVHFVHNAAMAPGLMSAGEDLLTLEGHGTTVGVEETGPLPKKFALKGNYPNPFNPTTRIAFDLPGLTNVTLTIYNTIGQQVAVLIRNEEFKPGSHEHFFDASAFPTGVYFYRIQTPEFSAVRKMVLLK